MQELCQILSLAASSHSSHSSTSITLARLDRRPCLWKGHWSIRTAHQIHAAKAKDITTRTKAWRHLCSWCVRHANHSLKIAPTYSVNSMHPRFSHFYLSINFIICSHSMSKHAVKTMTWDHCRIQVAFQMLQLVGALWGDLEMLSTGEHWYTHMSRNSALCCLSEHDPKTVDLRCHKCSKLIKVREWQMSQFTT